MKIAYLSTFYPFRGGVAQFNASLYQVIAKKYDIRAYTFTRQYPKLLFPGKTQYVACTDKVQVVPSIPVLDTINPLTYFKAASCIACFQPDILLMKYWMPFFAPALATVSSRLKKSVKIVSILDNIIPHERRPFDIPLTKYFLKQHDGFVVMSDAVRQDLLTLSPKARYIKKQHPLYDHFGQAPEKSTARKYFNINANAKVLLFFGFIRDYKGLDILLDAFTELDESYRLVIAGETYGSFDIYREQIEKSGKSNNILVYNNYVSDSQVSYFFAAADVCVLPYKSATQSGITSIAYHLNTPMIATDVGGLKETILHEKTGLIVEQSRPEYIAKAVKKYFQKNLAIPFQENITQLKKSRSWANFAQSIINFSESLPKK